MHNCEKNSKLKHVFPLGWIFLANPVWECTKVLYNYALNSGLSQNQELGTLPPCVRALLYIFNDDVMLSCPHHHAKLWWHHTLWQEPHMHAFRCVSSNPPLSVCLLVWSCSNHSYGIGDSNPGHTPWHIYVSVYKPKVFTIDIYILTTSLQLNKSIRINQDQQESMLLLCMILGLVFLNILQETSVFNIPSPC